MFGLSRSEDNLTKQVPITCRVKCRYDHSTCLVVLYRLLYFRNTHFFFDQGHEALISITRNDQSYKVQEKKGHKNPYKVGFVT